MSINILQRNMLCQQKSSAFGRKSARTACVWAREKDTVCKLAACRHKVCGGQKSKSDKLLANFSAPGNATTVPPSVIPAACGVSLAIDSNRIDSLGRIVRCSLFSFVRSFDPSFFLSFSNRARETPQAAGAVGYQQACEQSSTRFDVVFIPFSIRESNRELHQSGSALSCAHGRKPPCNMAR
jgi:hypothetical protein